MSSFSEFNEYFLINVAGKTAVDLHYKTSPDGAPVQGWAQNIRPGGENQIWRAKFVEKDKDGYSWYTFTNRATGSLLDLKNADPKNGTQIQGYKANSTNAQKWLVSPVSGGNIPLYQLFNRAASTVSQGKTNWRCLDLEIGNPANETKIQIWDWDTSARNNNQVWELIKVN